MKAADMMTRLSKRGLRTMETEVELTPRWAIRLCCRSLAILLAFLAICCAGQSRELPKKWVPRFADNAHVGDVAEPGLVGVRATVTAPGSRGYSDIQLFGSERLLTWFEPLSVSGGQRHDLMGRLADESGGGLESIFDLDLSLADPRRIEAATTEVEGKSELVLLWQDGDEIALQQPNQHGEATPIYSGNHVVDLIAEPDLSGIWVVEQSGIFYRMIRISLSADWFPSAAPKIVSERVLSLRVTRSSGVKSLIWAEIDSASDVGLKPESLASASKEEEHGDASPGLANGRITGWMSRSAKSPVEAIQLDAWLRVGTSVDTAAIGSELRVAWTDRRVGEDRVFGASFPRDPNPKALLPEWAGQALIALRIDQKSAKSWIAWSAELAEMQGGILISEAGDSLSNTLPINLLSEDAYGDATTGPSIGVLNGKIYFVGYESDVERGFFQLDTNTAELAAMPSHLTVASDYSGKGDDIRCSKMSCSAAFSLGRSDHAVDRWRVDLSSSAAEVLGKETLLLGGLPKWQLKHFAAPLHRKGLQVRADSHQNHWVFSYKEATLVPKGKKKSQTTYQPSMLRLQGEIYDEVFPQKQADKLSRPPVYALVGASDEPEGLMITVGARSELSFFSAASGSLKLQRWVQSQDEILSASLSKTRDGYIGSWISLEKGELVVHSQRADRDGKALGQMVTWVEHAKAISQVEILEIDGALFRFTVEDSAEEPGASAVFWVKIDPQSMAPLEVPRRISEVHARSHSLKLQTPAKSLPEIRLSWVEENADLRSLEGATVVTTSLNLGTARIGTKFQKNIGLARVLHLLGMGERGQFSWIEDASDGSYLVIILTSGEGTGLRLKLRSADGRSIESRALQGSWLGDSLFWWESRGSGNVLRAFAP